MPKALLLNIENDYADRIKKDLVLQGVETYAYDDLEQSLSFLPKNDIDFICLDVDRRGVDWVYFLAKLQHINQSNKNQQWIVVISKNEGIDFLKSLLLLGVQGYLPKHLEPEVISAQVCNLLQTFTMPERRRYVRIPTINKNDLIVKFLIPYEEDFVQFSGEVVNVSIAAIALELEKSPSADIFNQLEEIQDVQFFIEDDVFLIDLKIVIRGPIVIAFFIDPQEEFLNAVTRYISQCFQRQLEKNWIT